MPNGTYGGVRGRETKVIGGKLQESFVFLLLDLLGLGRPKAPAPFSSSMTLRGTIALPPHRSSDRSNILPPNNSIHAPQTPGPGRSADADFYYWG